MIEYMKTCLALKIDRRAVTTLEHALIAGVTVATILAGFNIFASAVSDLFNSIGGSLGSPPPPLELA